jgi:hypothetical protein
MWFRHANWIDKNNSFYVESVDIVFFLYQPWLRMNNNVRNITIIIDTNTDKRRKTTTRQPVAAARVRLYKQAGKNKEKERERRREEKAVERT